MASVIDILLFSNTEFLKKVKCKKNDRIKVIKKLLNVPPGSPEAEIKLYYGDVRLQEWRTFEYYNIRSNGRINVILELSENVSPTTKLSEWGVRSSPIVMIPSSLVPLSPSTSTYPPKRIPPPILADPLYSTPSPYPVFPTPPFNPSCETCLSENSFDFDTEQNELNQYHIDKPDALKSEFNTEKAQHILNSPNMCQKILFHDMNISELLVSEETQEESNMKKAHSYNGMPPISPIPPAIEKEDTLIDDLKYLKSDKRYMQQALNKKDALLQTAFQHPTIFEREDPSPMEIVTQQDKTQFMILTPEPSSYPSYGHEFSWLSTMHSQSMDTSSDHGEMSFDSERDYLDSRTDGLTLPEIYSNGPLSPYKDSMDKNDVNLTHREGLFNENNPPPAELSQHIHPRLVNRSHSISICQHDRTSSAPFYHHSQPFNFSSNSSSEDFNIHSQPDY